MSNISDTSPRPSWVASLGKWVPGVRAIRSYDRAWLAKDLIAGIILCALLVPQGMAYAELAGLPAITGLYTTVVCLFAYAAVGPSPYLVLGPDSSLGPMIAAVILPLAVVGGTKWREWLIAIVNRSYLDQETRFFPADQRDAAWEWLRT